MTQRSNTNSAASAQYNPICSTGETEELAKEERPRKQINRIFPLIYFDQYTVYTKMSTVPLHGLLANSLCPILTIGSILR